MNWFGCFRNRPPHRHAEPLNWVWTPETGQEIEDRYKPLIEAWEEAHGMLRQDFTPDQWRRFQVWVRLLDAGLSLRRLVFAGRLADTGRITDWPTDPTTDAGLFAAVRRRCWGEQGEGL